MLQFDIKNYDDFKRIFGTRNSSRGCIQNKILLSFWIHRFKIDKDGRASFYIKTLDQLYSTIMNTIDRYTIPLEDRTNYQSWWLDGIGHFYLPSKYSQHVHSDNITENFNGDPRFIVYNNIDNGHIETMKAGKFMRLVIETIRMNLGEQTMLYVCEEFQRRWEAKWAAFTDLTLHVDNNFSDIYDYSKQDGCFHSCMNDKKQWVFYRDCVNASAAYLTNKQGKIVARCILFHDVETEDGVKHNYAERIYGNHPFSRRILNQKLIDGGHCDLYKVVDAGCHDITAIMDVKTGKRIQSFVQIPININLKSVLSFQDTFKYYYPSLKIATNKHRCLAHYCLDHTHSHLESRNFVEF